MAISITNIARNSMKFSSVNLLAAFILLPTNIFVAKVLMPAEYGVYGFLGLWLMYANLIGPGLTISGYREIPSLIGKRLEKEAMRIQNITLTSDMLYSILPFLVILGASFFFTEPVLKIGLILIAISFIISRFVNYWVGINFLREKFNIVARGRLIFALVPPLVIVAGVYWLRVYALLVAPIIMALIVGLYYWRKGPINFRFMFNWYETVRLARVGVLLQFGALALWAFRLTDRTVIASMLPLEELGLYVFAMGFIMVLFNIPYDFVKVLHPILYKEIGRASSVFEGCKDARRITIYLALGTAIMIPLSQLGFYSVVSIMTPHFTDSIPIFYILSYNLYLGSIWTVANLILLSSEVNKQKYSLVIHLVGLILNIILDIIVVKLGYGVAGVALVTICTQGLVSIALYHLVRDYMFTERLKFLKFQIAIWFPFLLTVPFYFFHNYLKLTTPNIWTFGGLSIIVQVVMWGLVISIFYRSYLSLNEIKVLIKQTIKGA